ncbi:MAG: stage III sporulation protein AF [Oscillospiraceae bacterium]|nr:stage III sporulation protein AF [Oscillospiraceae bacterium]
MAEYIKVIGAAVILAALMDMLVPDGSFKGYCRLVFGFVLLAAVLSPVTGSIALNVPEYTGADMETAEIEARARILIQHRSNLEKIIEDEFPGCEAYVEVDGEGNVTRVTVENAMDAAATREYVRGAMGIEGSNVIINENKGASR